jgi:hypothetical protein
MISACWNLWHSQACNVVPADEKFSEARLKEFLSEKFQPEDPEVTMTSLARNIDLGFKSVVELHLARVLPLDNLLLAFLQLSAYFHGLACRRRSDFSGDKPKTSSVAEEKKDDSELLSKPDPSESSPRVKLATRVQKAIQELNKKAVYSWEDKYFGNAQSTTSCRLLRKVFRIALHLAQMPGTWLETWLSNLRGNNSLSQPIKSWPTESAWFKTTWTSPWCQPIFQTSKYNPNNDKPTDTDLCVEKLRFLYNPTCDSERASESKTMSGNKPILACHPIGSK